ncbi:MAG: hypothetical protein JXB45_09985 [Candidatus Krumholzibacteriota bacterium]|nr:hypothetical protein [Candidatus Krumholzibacteriota bacterium]
MIQKLLLSVILLILWNATAGAAEETLVFRFKGIGVEENLIDAVTVIFAGALDAEGKYISVSAYEVLGDVECHDHTCAIELAREAGLGKAITGSLTRLGNKIVIAAQLADVARESVIITVDGTALTEDDMDVVLKRLAKAISTGKKIDDTAEVGLITEKEVSEVRRRESFRAAGFRVGFLWPQSASFGGVDRLTAVDFVYQYDTHDYFLAGRWGLRWGGDLDNDGRNSNSLALLETKLGRYLTRKDFSPFISAGMGINWVKVREHYRSVNVYQTKEDSGTGLVLTAGGGFAAFRTYDFQFQFDIDYFVVFEKIGTDGNEQKYPQGVIFTFCIKRGKRTE